MVLNPPPIIPVTTTVTTKSDQRYLVWFVFTVVLFTAGFGSLVMGLIGNILVPDASFTLYWIIGTIILFVACTIFVPRLFAREQIIDQWSILLGGAEGKAEDVLQNTELFIRRTRAPYVKMAWQEISPSLIRSLLGSQRPFLVISHTDNANLKLYQMHVNAMNYGNNLYVSWYLVRQPSFWDKPLMWILYIPIVGLLILPIFYISRLAIAKQAGILGLDLFDEQDLRMYVTNAHHCLLEAVETLMMDLQQDITKIDRHSKGFLGIS